MADEFSFPFPFVVPPDPNLGRRVDLYFILMVLLGRGGMGAAYLAEHEGLAHIKCVIKLMLPDIARHPQAIIRFKTETKAVAMLKHDNIVKLQNFGVLPDGQLFMRFEYVEGKSLDRYIAAKGGKLTLRDAARLVFQVCDALQYAHDLGIVHRDLKPDNLLIESNPGARVPEMVKVVDFGIAKVISSGDDHTGSGMSMGTPRFMAPEQVADAAAATGRADVFSLAVILWLALTGDLPWGTPENDIVLYHKQRTETPARPSEDVMPAAVATLLLRCFSLDPDDRPTMHEFALRLARAIPAADGLQSGTAILKEVVPRWVVASPHDAMTLPNPDDGQVPAPRVPQIASASAPGADAGNSRPLAELARSAQVHTSTPGEPSEPPRAASAQAPTARARREAVAVASGPAVREAALSPALPPSELTTSVPHPSPPIARASLPRGPSAPLLAALPTGLSSQEFAVQEPAIDARLREPSIVAASEIETAVGTPGPQPYAHRELPAVVLSTTQLPELAQPVVHREPVPRILLPRSLRPRALTPRARRRLAIGIAACGLMAVASLALMRLGSHPTASDGGSGSNSARQAGSALNVAIATLDAGSTSPEPLLAADAPPQPVDAVRVAPAADATSQLVDAASRIPSPTNAGPSVLKQTSQKSATAEGAHTAPSNAKTSASTSASSSPTAPAASKATGELAILVKSWAVVWLNGKPFDEDAPFRRTLPAGRYRVRMQNEKLEKDETTTVVVSPGKTTTVEKNW